MVRTHLNMSQQTLSRKTGLSQTSISQIENGVKNPSERTVKRICKVLRIPDAVLYILGVDEDDIPAERKEMFERLFPQIKELAIQIIGNKKSELIKNN